MDTNRNRDLKTFKIDGTDKKALNLLLIENELEVWKLTIDACEECYVNDLDKVQIFKLEPEIDRIFVFRHTLEETIDSALEVFIRYEEYKYCAMCRDLKESIN